MTKWADYLISKVKYNSDHTHIIKVLTHVDKGDKVGQPGKEENRETVIANLKKGYTYCTITKGAGGNWDKGQMVRKIIVKGKEYIRTDSNETEKDNLGELPEF